MSKFRTGFTPLALCCALLLAGCGPEEPKSADTGQGAPAATAPAPQAVPADAVAVVNGKVISQATFDNYLELRKVPVPFTGTPEQHAALVNELVNMELVVQDAEKQGIDKQPQIALVLDNQRRGILANAAMSQYLQTHPVSDEELKREYDTRIGNLSPKEYKARHILTKSEDEAKQAIAALDKGAKFEDLAREKSVDNSAQEGGDLGWFSPGQMVKPFADAVVALEKGKYTAAPVQSDFGWHVILLEDVRDTQPPAFDEIKERLKFIVQNRIAQEYFDSLKASASIEVMPMPAPPAPAGDAAAQAPAEAEPSADVAPAPAEIPESAGAESGDATRN